MTSSSYTVQGMTCDHCVQSVTAGVSKIEGVTNVDVDLPSGRVVVTSSRPIVDGDVVEAIDEAGYQLVG